MNDTEHAERLEKIIDYITDIGIYPKRSKGEYEERSDWQNGWNACAFHVARRHVEIAEETSPSPTN